MQNLCNPEEQRLLERLKKSILAGTILARLDPSRRFYIKTGWSQDGMVAVILNQMSHRSQGSQRHKKITLKSVNLTSPWKESVYNQFLSSQYQRLRH